MKKEAIIALGLIILIAGAFAQTASQEESPIANEVSNYIKLFVEKEGIKESQIINISQVNLNNLPDEIEIKNIETNNIGLYKINYAGKNVSKKVFLVTYSTNELKKKTDYITKNIQSFVFGHSKESSSSEYLEIAGVQSGEKIGYVMMHSGSITGISTSLEITGGTGKLFIEVYKNGKDTSFGNIISPANSNKIDYALQSEDIIAYEPGDIISVYIHNTGDVTWKNAVVNIEATS